MKRIIIFTIIIGLTLLLSSCLRISRFQDNFEDAGFTSTAESNYVVEILVLDFNDYDIESSIYVFNKPSKVAIVIDFKDTDSANKAIEKSVVLQNLTSTFDIEEITKRNFLVIPIADNSSDEQEIIDIFQN